MDEQPKKKKWMFIPVLLAAVGGPYALVNGDAAKLLSSLKPSAEPTCGSARLPPCQPEA